MTGDMGSSNYRIAGVVPTPGRNCLLASIRDMLHFYNMSVRESDLYFICKGLHFTYDRFRPAKNLSDRFIYDIGSHITKNLSAYFPYEFIYQEGMPHENLKKILHKRKPVIVLLDPRLIPYNDRLFQPIGGQEMHSVIVFGYDDTRRIFNVADSTMVGNDGIFTCIEAEIAYHILEESVKGYLYILRDRPTGDLTLSDCVCRSLEDFLYPEESRQQASGCHALYESLRYIRLMDDKNLSELRFLIQAYFMPLFYYLEDVLSDPVYKDIQQKIRLTKHRWDVFYYKYFLKYKAEWSIDHLIRSLEINLNYLFSLLHEIVNIIKFKISRGGIHE